MAIYACSDIHGQYSLFKKMLEGIHFSMEDTLFVLGDIIDRGPESIPMLQDIMERPNVFTILGNHELMMYTEYRYPHRSNYWLIESNGGVKTKRAFTRLGREEKEKILDYIGDMYLQAELTIDGMPFLLSHSDFIPDQGNVMFRDTDYDTAFDLVWNSPWRQFEYVPESKYAEDGRVHVIGHVPVQRILRMAGPAEAYVDAEHFLINIDLGCAAIGRKGMTGGGLCCLSLTKLAGGEGRDAFSYYWPED